MKLPPAYIDIPNTKGLLEHGVCYPRHVNRVWKVRQCMIIAVLIVLGVGLNLLNMGARFAPIDPMYLQIRQLVWIGSIILLTLAGWRRIGHAPKHVLVNSVLWTCYGASVVIAGIYHQDAGMTFEGIWLGLGIPFIFLIAVPRLLDGIQSTAIIFVLIGSALPYILISLLSTPLTYPYRGIVANPNQMGMLVAGVIWALSALLYSSASGSKRVQIMMITGLLIGAYALLLYTGSRASLISALLATGTAVFGISRIDVQSRWKALMGILFILAGAFLIGEYINFDYSSLLVGIREKHDVQWADAAFSGREYAWSWALENTRFLGHGAGASMEAVGFTSHNSFVATLNDYGIVSLILLLAIMSYGLFMSMRVDGSCKVGGVSRFVPLIVMVGFWSLSMAEGLFGALGRGSTLAFFLSYGLVSNISARRKHRVRL